MEKRDVTCPRCSAGFQRIELSCETGVEDDYRCPSCGHTLEHLDGAKLVAYRMTVRPVRARAAQ